MSELWLEPTVVAVRAKSGRSRRHMAAARVSKVRMDMQADPKPAVASATSETAEDRGEKRMQRADSATSESHKTKVNVPPLRGEPEHRERHHDHDPSASPRH